MPKCKQIDCQVKTYTGERYCSRECWGKARRSLPRLTPEQWPEVEALLPSCRKLARKVSSRLNPSIEDDIYQEAALQVAIRVASKATNPWAFVRKWAWRAGFNLIYGVRPQARERTHQEIPAGEDLPEIADPPQVIDLLSPEEEAFLRARVEGHTQVPGWSKARNYKVRTRVKSLLEAGSIL